MSVHPVHLPPRTMLLGVLCALCPAALLPSLSAAAGTPKMGVTATLEQCMTEGEQAERSATFAGEMAGIPGSARMEMRIDVIERMPGDIAYHTVIAPGLGVWRGSAPGVKSYRYLKQVTNLAGPAFYRGVVRYRWLNGKGRLLATSILRTKRCEQPETEAPTTGSTAGSPPAPSA